MTCSHLTVSYVRAESQPNLLIPEQLNKSYIFICVQHSGYILMSQVLIILIKNFLKSVKVWQCNSLATFLYLDSVRESSPDALRYSLNTLN